MTEYDEDCNKKNSKGKEINEANKIMTGCTHRM